MVIPKTAKEIIDAILLRQTFTVSSLARKIGVNRSTIYSILQGSVPSASADMRLLSLYLKLNQQQEWIR